MIVSELRVERVERWNEEERAPSCEYARRVKSSVDALL